MKILQEYTWDAIRRNKKSSAAIAGRDLSDDDDDVLPLRILLYDVDGQYSDDKERERQLARRIV